VSTTDPESLHAALVEAMRHPGATQGAGRGSTSDLSVDEILLLHSVGWEPVDLVCGAAVRSIWMGVWNWGVGEIGVASTAHALAVSAAVQRIGRECAGVGGHGVVGMSVEISVSPHHVDAVLVGTAVRPRQSGPPRGRPFVSDLSTRDFALLHQAGWDPRGLAFGASFVHAPRRRAMTAVQQKSQNVELTNFTEALYAARESAMERMQASALEIGAKGVVDVQIHEGPMHFARHAIGFTAWGTAVVPGPAGHQYLRPRVVLPLDDKVVQFDARSLNG
jgi:uncharacterized protein YbjQ (UPF0145 family)